MLLHIDQACIQNRLGKPRIQNLNMQLPAHSWMTISSQDYTLASDLLRGLNAQGITTSQTWRFLNQPLQQWNHARYRSYIPFISAEPIGWCGSVQEMLRQPFRWKSHKNKTWPEEHISSWFTRLDYHESFLQEDCDTLARTQLLVCSLIRAMSLEPVILLIDDIWGSFATQDRQKLITFLQEWIVATPARAIISVDQSEHLQDVSDQHSVITSNGLQYH